MFLPLRPPARPLQSPVHPPPTLNCSVPPISSFSGNLAEQPYQVLGCKLGSSGFGLPGFRRFSRSLTLPRREGTPLDTALLGVSSLHCLRCSSKERIGDPALDVTPSLLSNLSLSLIHAVCIPGKFLSSVFCWTCFSCCYSCFRSEFKCGLCREAFPGSQG